MTWSRCLLASVLLFGVTACDEAWLWDTWNDGVWEDWGGEFAAGAPDGPVRIESLRYEVEVWDQIAAGCIEAHFTADEGESMTATHRFVLPEGAVIYRADAFFAVSQRWERAVTLGRREGQAVFEEVVAPRPPRDPLLLQHIGEDTYRARAYPVGADQPLRTRICYAHLIDRDSEGGRLQIPFADPGDPVDRIAAALGVEVQLHGGGWSSAVWSGPLGDGRFDEDLEEGRTSVALSSHPLQEDVVVELQSDDATSAVQALVYRPESPALDDHIFVTYQPDFTDYPSVSSQPRNVVLVIDVSGSMAGAKLEEAKAAVMEALWDLAPEDHFGLVAFDTHVQIFHGEMSSGDDVAEALSWVSALESGSSTNISGGLAAGATIGATSPLVSASIDLVLLTDGRPTNGANDVDGILTLVADATEESGRSARIFSCGIGHDLDRRLLNDIATRTGGETTFALDDAELAGQFLTLFERVRSGGATEVSVGLQGGGIDEPQLFTFRQLFPGDRLALAARGRMIGVADITLTAIAPDGNHISLAATARPDVDSDWRHQLAAPLAAQAWADRLNRDIDAEGEVGELVDRAVILAKKYGILTRYSSLLALETAEMYAEHGIEKVERDVAGIALQPVTASSADESRIGGAGESGGETASVSLDEKAVGCGCASGQPTTAPAAVLVIAMVILGCRRRGGVRDPGPAKQ